MRLETLDDRRQIVLNEADGNYQCRIWVCICYNQPTLHEDKGATPQILSRFPVRLRLEYPPKEIEKQIIKYHVNFDSAQEGDIGNALKLANILREAASLEELYYSPSIRESIAFARLLLNQVSPIKAAEVVYANVYDQWGRSWSIESNGQIRQFCVRRCHFPRSKFFVTK